MAKSSLAPGKRRYSLSLTVSNVDEFQKLAKEFGMPQNQMSITCDDAIREISGLFQLAKSQGKFTVKDLFTLMGQQMELAINEERSEINELKKCTETPQKRNTGTKAKA